MANILGIAILIILALFFAWLARKGLGIRHQILKWPATFLAGLLTLGVLSILVVALIGFFRLTFPPYRYPDRDLKVDLTSERIARGEKMAHVCIDCHSSTGQLPMDGSKGNMLAGGPPLGELYAPNLTPAGPLKDWSDAEIMRALREGVDREGHPLVVMPSQAIHYASDEDTYALIAYLRSQPAVNNDLPPRNLSVLASIMVGAGLFPTSAQPPILEAIVAPAPGTVEYGAYMAASLGCGDCHGKDLSGSSGGPGPSGPNLRVIVPSWDQGDFVKFFRQGQDPSGRIVADVMPWKNYGQALSDDDLNALYQYLVSLQPAEESKR